VYLPTGTIKVGIMNKKPTHLVFQASKNITIPKIVHILVEFLKTFKRSIAMGKHKNENQIVAILKEAKAGVVVKDICCRYGVVNSTFYKFTIMYKKLGVWCKALLLKSKKYLAVSAEIEPIDYSVIGSYISS
jgi:putative transposase